LIVRHMLGPRFYDLSCLPARLRLGLYRVRVGTE
jgi:hypothetical protein